MKACFSWYPGEYLAPSHGRQTRSLFYSGDQAWAETYAYTRKSSGWCGENEGTIPGWRKHGGEFWNGELGSGVL